MDFVDMVYYNKKEDFLRIWFDQSRGAEFEKGQWKELSLSEE